MPVKIKNTLFVILLFFLYSCSATRKNAVTNVTDNSNLSANKAIELCKEKNIAEKGFFIKNGKIKIESRGFSGEFDFYAKVNSTGDFVVSCKGPFDIELFRAYGNADSVFLIDKINRQVFGGDKNALIKKYGLPSDFWVYLIGDIPENAILKNRYRRSDEFYFLTETYGNVMAATSVGKKSMKAEETVIKDLDTNEQVSFNYKSFKGIENYSYPEYVTITSDSLMFHVEIEIKKFSVVVNQPIKPKIAGYKIVGM